MILRPFEKLQLLSAMMSKPMCVGVAQRRYKSFKCSLRKGKVRWQRLQRIVGTPTITDRYSHTASYLNGALYIFGGCTASNTTFNDLWRLDLASRQWIRPMASGKI